MALALRNRYRHQSVVAGRTNGGPAVAARAAAGAAAILIALARLVRIVAGLVVLLIALAIVLRLVHANGGNSLVHDIHDGAHTLVGPFDNMFSIRNGTTALTVNWGIAAVIYLLAGGFIARLLARAAVRP